MKRELRLKRLARRAAALAVLALPVLAPLSLAWARPGGGETFSGPSHDSGGGGDGGHGDGGDGGELVIFLLRLIIVYPKLGIPVALIAIVWFVLKSRSGSLENWDTPHHAHVAAQPVRPASRHALQQAPEQLERLRALDPDFSRVLLEDFAYRLYASVQRARADQHALLALAPYLSDEVRASLARPDLQSITNVVVAALRIERVSLPTSADAAAMVRVQLVYDANLKLTASDSSHTLYARERWTLSRASNLRSKPPGSYESLGCPNCAAPFQATDNRRCAHCGQVVGDGRFNWQLSQRQVISEQERPPALGGHVPERGTDRPTLSAPDQEQRWRELLETDPALSEAGLHQRVTLIYDELNAAWSARELVRVRGLVSDGMFDYLSYWIDAYRAQGLRNVLESMRIETSQRVKVVEDRYFHAVTLRLFAVGLDYTVQAQSGELVSGDRSSPRRYSEYWTLIRGAQVRGAPKLDRTCPSCAAPLQISMAGSCTHCSAHITNGEFDWVLSKIEQDDVYDG